MSNDADASPLHPLVMPHLTRMIKWTEPMRCCKHLTGS